MHELLQIHRALGKKVPITYVLEQLHSATIPSSDTKNAHKSLYFSRELFQESLLNIIYAPPTNQFADILTKSLPVQTHQKLLYQITSFSGSGGMLAATSSKDPENAV